jgi:hypothetical protein
MRWFGLSLVLLVSGFMAMACGNDAAAPEGGGTDEDYLKAVCTGISNFSGALISKTTAKEIGDVIQQFIDEMEKVDPPADLVAYNKSFVQYLKDSLSDPTSLVTKTPPEPPQAVRDRLAAKESSIAECKDPTFFSRKSP